MELKPGDIVDGYDSTKIWYLSTVIDRSYRREDDNEFL